MSFGIYRYEHSQFGPMMLLLDSQLEDKQEIVGSQSKVKSRYLIPQNKQKLEEYSIEKKRGASFNKSPINNKSFQRHSFGQKSLEKKRSSGERSVILPMIPKGKKKKIDI